MDKRIGKLSRMKPNWQLKLKTSAKALPTGNDKINQVSPVKEGTDLITEAVPKTSPVNQNPCPTDLCQEEHTDLHVYYTYMYPQKPILVCYFPLPHGSGLI